MNNYNEKKDTAKNSPLANLYNCRLSANLDEHNISNLLITRAQEPDQPWVS